MLIHRINTSTYVIWKDPENGDTVHTHNPRPAAHRSRRRHCFKILKEGHLDFSPRSSAEASLPRWVAVDRLNQA